MLTLINNIKFHRECYFCSYNSPFVYLLMGSLEWGPAQRADEWDNTATPEFHIRPPCG